MSRFRTVLTLTCILGLPMALGGCAGLLIVGGLTAAAGGGYAAAQERGVDGSVNDLNIKTDVDKALLQTDPQLEMGILATVYNGRVLLTGRLPNQQMKMTAGQVAGRVHDVRGVYNEIEVANAETMWDGTKDAWITTRVRSEMVLDPDIRSVNFSIDTSNGSVYLMGSARSQGELDHATKAARYVPGVRRVVSYVELRYGSPVAAAPVAPNMGYNGMSSGGMSSGGTAPGGIAPSGPAPYAVPRASIEVQKL